jgi:hypothetical protein
MKQTETALSKGLIWQTDCLRKTSRFREDADKYCCLVGYEAV